MHKHEFDKVVRKYGLDKRPHADRLADLLSGKDGQTQVAPEELVKKFGLDLVDAKCFLSWIYVGVTFKKDHLDGNAGMLDGKKGQPLLAAGGASPADLLPKV